MRSSCVHSPGRDRKATPPRHCGAESRGRYNGAPEIAPPFARSGRGLLRIDSRSLLAALFTVASCGGAKSTPRAENEPAASAAPGHEAQPKAPASAEGAGSAAIAPPESPASVSKSASGDLVAPTSDDPWMAPHQMPRSDVLKTMRSAQGKVNACWQAAKKRDPSVSGEVKIKFVTTHEGSVRVWRNEDSALADEDCVNCVGEVLKSLQFPKQKSPGDAWGMYQITFGD